MRENDGKEASDFLKSGYVSLSPSKKSLKITLNDPYEAFTCTYYVSVADVQKALAHPSFAATIVRLKEESLQGRRHHD